MITTLLAHITLPCKEVTRLASQAMDRPLPWATRLSLRLHYWICDACARYRVQLHTIRQILRRSGEQCRHGEAWSPSPAIKTRLTEAFRARLK
ncbi:MAG: zf-HC2 domain-containing protein [Nitrospira sp.]|nr:zf-HC2 domain-containing protein [Nitrospira sp.]